MYTAKLQTSEFVMEKNKSFMKTFKRKRPRSDPCDTPVLISHHELKDESIFVLVSDYFSISFPTF